MRAVKIDEPSYPECPGGGRTIGPMPDDSQPQPRHPDRSLDAISGHLRDFDFLDEEAFADLKRDRAEALKIDVGIDQD
jgi:hypothetical protein